MVIRMKKEVANDIIDNRAIDIEMESVVLLTKEVMKRVFELRSVFEVREFLII